MTYLPVTVNMQFSLLKQGMFIFPLNVYRLKDLCSVSANRTHDALGCSVDEVTIMRESRFTIMMASQVIRLRVCVRPM